MIRVNEEDQLQLLVELKRLREQNTELQERGTRYELENRDLREIVRRLSEFPPLSAHAQYRLAQFDEKAQAAALDDELRRQRLWKSLRSASR